MPINQRRQVTKCDAAELMLADIQVTEDYLEWNLKVAGLRGLSSDKKLIAKFKKIESSFNELRTYLKQQSGTNLRGKKKK